MTKKGEETKQFIKQGSVGLFAKRGFKEVTMKDICECTGLSRGGLYRYYESTKQIFSDIIADFLSVQGSEFENKIISRISAVQILDQVLEKYKAEMLDTESSLSMAIYEYYSSIDSEESDCLLSQQYQQSFEFWDKLIKYGISSGEFNNVDANGVFNLIVFSYQGVRMYGKIMNISAQIPESICKQIKNILIMRTE